VTQDPSSLQSARSGAFESHSRALDRCVREAIPDLADFCFVHVATARTLRCVAAAHGTPHLTRAMRMLVPGTPIRRDDLVSTVAFVVRTRKPTLRKGIVDDDAAEVRSARAQLQRKLAPRSALRPRSRPPASTRPCASSPRQLPRLAMTESTARGGTG